MSLVKPPSFRELAEKMGEAEAVRYLLKIGYGTAKVVEESGLPYHRVILYREGVKSIRSIGFSRLALFYERLSGVRSRKAKESLISRFLSSKVLPVDVMVNLLTAKPFKNLGVGPGTIRDSLALASRWSPERVEALYREYGEYGEVAYLILRRPSSPLTVKEVYLSLKLLSRIPRRGRVEVLASLLSSSSRMEGKYIVRLALGDLKLGFKENTLLTAASKAFNVDRQLLENASAIKGLAEACRLASIGEYMLRLVELRPGLPFKPMLAHLYREDKVKFPVRVELKYDGSRLQIHKMGEEIKLYTRRLVEKSDVLPEVVDIAKGFNADNCIVDCEAIAVDDKGNPLPFQYLLERTLPRKYESERAEKVRVTIKAFDIVYYDGRSLLSTPLQERIPILMSVVPREFLAEGETCTTPGEVEKYFKDAVGRGYEGIMVKALDSIYEPGKRTYTWLKLKPLRDTIDAVVVKAYYGTGLRAGYYSSLLLAIRDPEDRKLYTIGRVSNISEDLMDRLKTRFDQLIVRRDRDGIVLRPEVVVEVTYMEIQKSPEYSSGYALRVPKIVRVRNDKTVEEIDTLDKIREIYMSQAAGKS